ncbi:MAG TPA: hypothetical protein VN180_03660 [Acidimicrobiia bacterium]|jgi:hypothetical protein|nr:hypothetical protein [Acidimicrobiia bacterium]
MAHAVASADFDDVVPTRRGAVVASTVFLARDAANTTSRTG